MFTDREQNILLSAMGREKQIYEKVDESGKFAKENLTEVCNAIIRKIYDMRNKYQWHDLINNPWDLPKQGQTVDIVCKDIKSGLIVRTYGFYEKEFYEEYWTERQHYNNYEIKNSVIVDKVIAWRKISPFDGGK